MGLFPESLRYFDPRVQEPEKFLEKNKLTSILEESPTR
jgi:hypothetical protein